MESSKEVAEVITAAKMIASMKFPSVEKLLRQYGYGYEASRVADLVVAVEKLERYESDNNILKPGVCAGHS